MAEKTVQKPKPEQKPQASNTTKGEMGEALQKAHEARKAKAEERAKLPENEQIRLSVKESVRTAAQRLTIGRGNVAATLGRHRNKLSENEKQKVVEYLESQLGEVKKAAFGGRDERGKFDL